MYGLVPEKPLRLVYEPFCLAIRRLNTFYESSLLIFDNLLHTTCACPKALVFRQKFEIRNNNTNFLKNIDIDKYRFKKKNGNRVYERVNSY